MASQQVAARVQQGHRVASGLNGDPLFPGGTLRMQQASFQALGLDITHLHPGTVNVSLHPRRYRVVQAKYFFRNVKWHPTEPAEDFSFFDARILLPEQSPVSGLVYYPHPSTKPTHFQKDDVLELLLPWIEGLDYGTPLTLEVQTEQIVIF